MEYNCCVPGCNNSHRYDSLDIAFYCKKSRRINENLLFSIAKNDSLKVDSSNMRIFSKHWEVEQNSPSIYISVVCSNQTPPKQMIWYVLIRVWGLHYSHQIKIE